MTRPKRIQLSRERGWRKPANTVVVSRPSQWGNPYKPNGVLSRDVCVEAYRGLLSHNYKWFGNHGLGWTAAVWFTVHKNREETLAWVALLRGKNLACWCPLVDADGRRVPCHADVLLEIANQERP